MGIENETTLTAPNLGPQVATLLSVLCPSLKNLFDLVCSDLLIWIPAPSPLCSLQVSRVFPL